MSRVTDFDRHVASRLKELRSANSEVSMMKLARFLGITYQSYQAMERGEVSFRASVLSKIAVFFKTDLNTLIGSEEIAKIQNIGRVSYVVDILSKLPEDKASELVNIGLSMVREQNNGSK